MKILVINSGSSSIKFQFFDLDTEEVLCKGLLERIGQDEGIFNYTKKDEEKIVKNIPIEDHKDGLELVLEAITDNEHGVINSINEIDAVGHRIVHGGDRITDSVILNEESLKICEECSVLAPLHNPPNLMGVYALKELLDEKIPHVGVFDTAFHATMPEESFIYPLPYAMYTEHGIRRFGFHGTSHKYVAMKAAEHLGIPFEKFSGITVHLGNGSSITAVRDGKSVDTSLGYGTMCGVPMGTRAGDFDPAIILYMIEKLGLDAKDINGTIYKASGLLGLSGISSDYRDVESAAREGHGRAQIAIDVLTHSIGKYILALSANLDKIDAVVFTAGIGENSASLRKLVCNKLKVLGVKLDETENLKRGVTTVISSVDSGVRIMTVPTNEELMIALETKRLTKKSVS
ncbi:MAG: acetate kinase [Candidatus Cloacimonetes bacterium]|nr:acetate kinase [Candidatus Cloacimonadota bacterium]